MPVIVNDLFTLELFNNAQLFCGEKGLTNEIKRVNFSDCPLIDQNNEQKLVMKNDLFINSLYIVKDDEQKLFDYFKFYISSGSAGIIIIDEFIKQLPYSVKKYADENNFPVIFINTNIPYAEIIQNIMEMILNDKTDTILEMQIDKLLDKNTSKDEIINIARHINSSFNSYYSILFLKTEQNTKSTINELKNYSFVKTIKYKDGNIIIVNFDKHLDVHLEELKKFFNYNYCSNYILGISNIFTASEDFANAISQAISSYEIAKIIGSNIVYYKNLNTYKILFPLKETLYLKDFYNEIFMPLKNHDDCYKADLIKTIEVYLKNNGDYKKVAQKLYQHENTIRYKILKAKTILGLENNHFDFIEQISIAFKIHKLKNLYIKI